MRLMLMLAVTIASSAAMSSQVASANFAVDLLRQSASPSQSYVLSPFSLGSALAIVHDGARGETKQQLTQLLAGDANAADNVTTHYSELTTLLANPKGDVVNSVANRFFLNKDFDLKDSYSKHVQEKYNAGAEKLDFNQADAAAKTVNSFVDKNTGGMIPKLLEPDAFNGAAAVLINAIYFKGKWAKAFEPNNTEEDTFYGVEGERKEKFMYARELKALYYFDDTTQTLSLPYKDGTYSLVVIMPKEKGHFEEWRKKLTGQNILDRLQNLRSGDVNVKLPKFKIESTMDGKQVLSKLGVTQIFDERNADLGEISENKDLYVSKVVHKAVIDVTEEGTEAAAATGIAFVVMSLPIIHDFTADHSFLYAIVKDKREIVFLGQFA